MTRFRSFAFLLIICSVFLLNGQDTGIKFIDNYSPDDYGLQPQNWCVLQDQNGLIYIGNEGNLIEYDGVSWTQIQIPNRYVPSMDIDKYGTIYIGGQNELGYLSPDSRGKMQYISLMDHLPDEDKKFETVRRTHVLEDGVYYRTAKYIFRWNPGQKQLQVLLKETPGKRIRKSFVCSGNYYIIRENIGMLVKKGDTFQLIQGGEIFANKKVVYMMVPYGQSLEKILIGTRKDGFFIFDGEGVTPFPTEVDNYLKENKANYGISLSQPGGSVAISTLNGGIVVIDSEGRLECKITRKNGLRSNNVKYLYQDYQGNIWAGLGDGLSKIEYKSPISYYNEEFSALPGKVYSVLRQPDSRFYVGTSRGLFRFEFGTGKFIPVSTQVGASWSIIRVNDLPLVATSTGTYQFSRDNVSRISNDSSYFLLHSRFNHNRIWVGSWDGVISLGRKTGSDGWELEHRFDEIGEIRLLAEDENGNLWGSLLSGGVVKIEFQSTTNIDNYSIKKFDQSHRLPVGRVTVFWAADHLMFGADDGLFRYDASTNGFVPDYSMGKSFSEQLRSVYRLVEDKDNSIWLHAKGRNYKAVLQQDNTYKIEGKPYARLPISWQVNAFYPDPVDNVAWMATHKGLVRYDANINKDYQLPYNTVIRRISVNGTVYFDRPSSSIPEFLYKNRDYRFEYAAYFYENQFATKYRYLLEGYDENWSGWTGETRKDYTNLGAGDYTFRVQARNIYGTLGKEDVFKFKILPPWYQTLWAYGLYALVAVLLFWLSVKWRSNKLLRDKQRLERVVKERTEELDKKNRLLVNQARQLEELDRAKSRFFANISHEFRTPLTLILGPLEKMLSRQPADETRESLELMQRNSQRLLHLINRLLNLSQIDSGKMKLNAAPGDMAAFIRNAIAPFEAITINNNLHLEFNTSEETVTLFYDTEKAEEILLNLLSNAVKFTPPGGRITITLDVFPTEVEDFPQGFIQISVKDTGPGISRDQLERIFERFVSIDSDTQKTRGSGIGLALTRELVLLHHGKIDLHSRGGEGTEFVISLPMGDAHLGEDEKAAGVELSEPRFTGLEDLRDEEGEKIESEEDSEGEGSDKPTVLVVEDNRDMRRFIRGAIEEDYIVLEAADGKEGIEIAKSKAPDLVVSDIMMPGMDGYQLCRQLKQDIETSHIPVILLTAKAAEDDVIEGLETGADDYVTKPFSANILNSRIKNLIQLRNQLQEKFQRELVLKPSEIKITSIDEIFLNRLQEILEKNLSDPELNVEALSEKMEMSTVTLNKKIRYLTGETTTDFIRSYRLKRGMQLLKSNFGTVTEVAFAVGFSSHSYFSKCFKGKFGQKPSQISG